MKRLLPLLLLALALPVLFVHTASAQDRLRLDRLPSEPIPHSGTHVLMQRPEVQSALREYHALRDAGFPNRQARATVQPPELNDTRDFRVYDFETGEYEQVEFTLKVIEERFYIWVETAQLGDEQVRAQDLDSLRRYLGEATPPGSLYPDRGIIANDEEVFGAPPNVDSDGKSDVLVHDIRDSYDPEDSPGYTAGYVDASDLTSQGNNRDILYLDSYPGIYRGAADSLTYSNPVGLAATAAHEYQHLIHNAYDRNELTFVNEGQSEWAEVMNGFSLRSPGFLVGSDGYNVPLLRWSQNDPDTRFHDYQRAALFTTYLAGRIGAETTGAITRDTQNGAGSYEQALSAHGLSLADVVADYHVANVLNDSAVDPRFGYAPPIPHFTATPSLVVDGRTVAALDETQTYVQPGGVYYVTLKEVMDPVLTVSGTGLRARLILRDEDGSVSVQDVSLPATERRFEGTYDDVTLILAHTDPRGSRTRATYEASWTMEQLNAVANVQYDDGVVAQADGSFLFITAADIEQLTRFDSPDPGRTVLSSVKLPLYFYSQFGNDDAPPESAPRDFTLTVRAVDASGAPGALLFERTLDDPRSYQGAQGEIAFADIDLSAYADELEDLPPSFFVGFHDAGTDENVLVMAPSTYDVENRSFLHWLDDDSYRALWDVQLSGGTTLADMVIPIRAEFLLPIARPTVQLATPLQARDVGDLIRLEWTTLYEHQLEQIEVERAVDAGAFETLASLDGRGSLSNAHTYTLDDSDFPAEADTLRYRLHYVFADSSAYSNVASVSAPQEAVVLSAPITASDLESGTGYRLSWNTTSERGLEEFVVQRSVGQDRDADYVSLDTVPRTGDGSSGGAYTFDDESWPSDADLYEADTLYYRLQFVLTDGTTTYSESTALSLQEPAELALFGNFPNPVAGTTQIRYEVPGRQQVRLVVYDLLGREVAVLVDEEQEGRQQIEFNASGLGAGVYLYVLDTEEGRRTRQMVVLQRQRQH